ncbi:replicative DNA helicase [Cerasibacillus quisquiliarum]|uniref:Replicative DNA helicase n=1 Tax=Cerasibacillus quisquiliarum TaxID=227865 RepID=A0A511UXU4_9BACI|nr:replicative DNA helicase [Cerasibacillus quisquiliarum]MBB5144844.1 replicative DNA helicase [Cerasibacillus quisquiliarum]GEN30263.1 replicative DNA helicase [Cerasibacillus quisquiliarum]
MMENREAEQSVIGSVLMEGELYKDLRLEHKHFGSIIHQKIYQAIERVADKEQSIDLVTVTTELADDINSVGGVSYLTNLATSIPTTANLRHYESAVFEAYRNRTARQIALQYAENPNDERLHELIAELETLKEVGVQAQEKTLVDHLSEIVDDMSASSDELNNGFKTGFTDFDNMTGGLQRGDLVIIAARPSVGKTAFSLNMGSGHCKNGGTTHIFSLEMLAKQLLQRMISSEGRINGQKWRSMAFSTDDYSKAMRAIGIISNWKLNIYDQTRTINDIRAIVRKAVNDAPDEKHLVIIDYLQLMQTTGRYENRNLEVGSMTRDLKLLAMELNIPIVVLSQLSRGVEQRQDKRPMLSDLRDSGNIEQDADVVGFLYRDDYYDKESEKQNIIEIILSKQRNGPTGTVELAFLKEYGAFLNLDYRYSEDDANARIGTASP